MSAPAASHSVATSDGQAHRHGQLLNDHRRAELYAALLLAAFAFMLFAVGRHPTDLAPLTTFRPIGRLDARVYAWIVPHRNAVFTAIFKVFDYTGKGIVTIPLRIVLVAVLLLRRRWAAAIAFSLTWASSEIALQSLKDFYMRGRPPEPLVTTVGYSFPSGHATAAAAIGVAVVLAFLHAGHRRRVWIVLALVIAFVMAFSRVYLGAHWLSDVETGVLLGSVSAIASFALVEEVRVLRRRRSDPPHASSATV